MVVLVLEDDDDLRASLSDLFRWDGHTVVETGYGSEACNLVLGGLSPDVAFLDARLPDFNGWAVARVVRECLPSCRIYIFTGWFDHEKHPELEDGTVDGFLRKPAPTRELLALVRGLH